MTLFTLKFLGVLITVALKTAVIPPLLLISCLKNISDIAIGGTAASRGLTIEY
jgi:hypothetical protein